MNKLVKINFIMKIGSKIRDVYLKFTNESINWKLISLYLIYIFGLFPVYLYSNNFQTFSVKTLIFFILTIISVVIYIVILIKKKVVLRDKIYQLDINLFILFCVSFFEFVFKVLKGNYDTNFYLLIIVSILSYFLISTDKNCKSYFHILYLRLFSVCTIIIYTLIIIQNYFAIETIELIGILISDRNCMLSFLILSNMINIILFCISRNKYIDIFYIFSVSIGFILLFIQNDIISILLVGALFLLIPIIFMPTVELVKRNLIILFVYLFLLNNIYWILNYFNILNIGVNFNMFECILLDLIIMVIGILVLEYWDRVPINVNADYVVMKRLYRIFVFLLKIYGLLVIAVLTAGSIKNMPNNSNSIILFKRLYKYTFAGLQQCEGIFKTFLIHYGLLGLGIIIISYVLVAAMLKKNHKRDKKTAILTTTTIIFMLQSLFYKQQEVTTPIYAILSTFAVFNIQNIERYRE